VKKKVVLEKAGTDLKVWQAKYADWWRKFTDNDAFQAGIQFLRNQKLDSVANLNEKQIEENAREYISNLRGYLQHEQELLKLHEMTEFTLPYDEETEYLSPEQEAEQEQLRAKFREETKKQRYAT